MKIAIVGAGLIGKERIEAINLISEAANNEVGISSVYDINIETLLKIKEKYNVNISQNISDVFALKPDWVFIATPNDVVKDIAEQAFNVGANVLMEKPFGRSLYECEEIIKLKPDHCKLNIGFNYRFFDGIEAALYDVKNGKFGKLISVNLILGHGNSPGMEKSWRFDPKKCGDCATDLGVHLFDLILQLSDSDLFIDYAKSWSGFWNTGIDEEAHIIALNNNGAIFNIQTSLNRWKSTFKLEINGTEGYGVVEGRGKNYGYQSYKTGVRWGWLSGKSPSESEIIVIDRNDCANSFKKETASVLGMSHYMKDYKSLSSACEFQDARKTMALLEQYKVKKV